MRLSRDVDKFMLRLPDGMRTTLKIRAAGNRRSMNSEILALLERALREGENDGRAKFGDQTLPSSEIQPVRAG